MERNIKAHFGVPTVDNVDYTKIYVYNTDDINPKELFFPYLANRGAREDNGLRKHVLSIADSIVKHGSMEHLPPIIIDINTLQIADGNCRFNAMVKVLENGLEENLKLRVIYENIPENDFDERVKVLNETQKGWTLLDFIYNFSLRGYDSFTKLIEFCENNKSLHDGKKINPRYGGAALRLSTNDLKKSTLSITDEDIENGNKAVAEAAEIRKLFSTDLKANGGGWYEQYLRAWAEFRGELGDITFKNYLKEVSKSVKYRKREVTIPYGSNKKKDWNSFFRTVKTYVE